MKENCTFLTSSWGEMYILVAAVVLTPCQGLANIELSGMCIEKGNCGKNRIQGKTLSSTQQILYSKMNSKTILLQFGMLWIMCI